MKASLEEKLKKVHQILEDVKKHRYEWEWHMHHKAMCSDSGVLAALGVLPKKWATTSQRQIGLTPYTLKLLLDLKSKDYKAFRAQQLQTFFAPTEKPIQKWSWARKPALRQEKSGFWHWFRKLLPQFLQIFFSLSDQQNAEG